MERSMATDLVVPALGESISDPVIARWLAHGGQAAAPGEPLDDLEPVKRSVQLPAPAGGVLVEQGYAEGATGKVGEVIGRIDEKATAPQPTQAPPKTNGKGQQAAAPAAAAPPAAQKPTTSPSPSTPTTTTTTTSTTTSTGAVTQGAPAGIPTPLSVPPI